MICCCCRCCLLRSCCWSWCWRCRWSCRWRCCWSCHWSCHWSCLWSCRWSCPWSCPCSCCWNSCDGGNHSFCKDFDKKAFPSIRTITGKVSLQSESFWLSRNDSDVTLAGLGAQFSERGCIIYSQIESVIGALQVKVKNHDCNLGVWGYRYHIGAPEKQIIKL